MGKRGRKRSKGGGDAAPASASEYRDGEGNVLLIRARDTRPCRHSGNAGNFRTAAWTPARVQLESALTVRVDEVRPSFAAGQPDEYERQDHSRLAWAEPSRVESAHAQFYPARCRGTSTVTCIGSPSASRSSGGRHQVESLDVEAS